MPMDFNLFPGQYYGPDNLPLDRFIMNVIATMERNPTPDFRVISSCMSDDGGGVIDSYANLGGYQDLLSLRMRRFSLNEYLFYCVFKGNPISHEKFDYFNKNHALPFMPYTGYIYAATYYIGFTERFNDTDNQTKVSEAISCWIRLRDYIVMNYNDIINVNQELKRGRKTAQKNRECKYVANKSHQALLRCLRQ